MRCALKVLHMLHVNQVYGETPVDIILDETKNTKHVQATGAIPTESSLLPRVCQRANFFRNKACTRIGWPLQ